jgi:Uma2 family endonuclease
MAHMSLPRDVIEEPLSGEELAARYRAMCEDPCLARVPGKLELDLWGRMVMTPPGTYHGLVQGRLCQRLAPLGGQTYAELAVVTAFGLFVADVAWGSRQFAAARGKESPFMRAPEICLEVVSPSNSAKEMEEKRAGYLGAGALEVWLLFLHSKRIEFHGERGVLERSRFAVNLDGIFDEA